MQLEFTCPDCEQTYSVDTSWAGRKVECTACGSKFYLPELDDLACPDSPASSESSAEVTRPVSETSVNKLAASARTTRPCPRCLRPIPARAMVCMHCLADDAQSLERLSAEELGQRLAAEYTDAQLRQTVAAALSLIPGDVASQALNEVYFAVVQANGFPEYISSAHLQTRALLLLPDRLLANPDQAALRILQQLAHHVCKHNPHDQNSDSISRKEQDIVAWQTVKQWVPQSIAETIDALQQRGEPAVAKPAALAKPVVMAKPAAAAAKPTVTIKQPAAAKPEVAPAPEPSASQLNVPRRKKLTLHR